MLLVFEYDFQVGACICWQFMMEFKVLHLKILWGASFSNIYKVVFTACPCFLAYDLSKNNTENLLLLAGSISSISLLASAQGNEMEPYAFRQELTLPRSIFSICLLASALGKNLDYAVVS
jgi:hypothetical protein